jgi:hypothetical protein
MKICIVFLAVALAVSSSAAEPPSCLIVKHATAASQFLVSGANWRYVAGDFPKDIKWKSNIPDRDIRKIKEKGGRVVVIPETYGVADLEQAQTECKAPEK